MITSTVARFVLIVPSLSVTAREKVRVSPAGPTDGAVNVGDAMFVADSVTGVPVR